MRLAVLALAIFLPVFAGSLLNEGGVHGTVSDPSGARVSGAAVHLLNPISGHERKLSTGPQGEFQLLGLPPNTYHLTVQRDGFEPYEADLTVRSAVPVQLEIKLTVVGGRSEVRVEAYGTDVIENVPYAHYDADRKSFSKLPTISPASGLSDAITMAAPGVVADSNGFFHPLGDHAQAGFLVDGQPITDQQSKQFSTQMPLNAFESMELITGGANAEYGDKTSLVINAQTRSGLASSRPFGNFNTQYGSFGTVGQETDFGFGGKKFGNFLVANASRSGRFLDTPEFRPLHAIGNSQVIYDRMDYRLNDRNAFRLGIFGARNWFQVPNSLEQLSQDQRQQSTTFSVSPGFTQVLSPRALWNVNAFFRRDQLGYFPSRNPEDDAPASVSQDRQLTHGGARGEVAYVRGRHNVKVGAQLMQTRLNERFSLTSADEEIGRIRFNGRGTVNQFAFFAQDSITLGALTLNVGLRVDRYRGFSQATMAQPRVGASYLIKPTGTILRYAYSRTMETPYNENLVLASSGSQAIPVGRRNQHNLGVQQALGRWAQVDADYFWKDTRNAFDFESLFNTPIFFPVALQRSRVDGLAFRFATATFKGIQAFTTIGTARARYQGPSIGGAPYGHEEEEEGDPSAVFRIDHDQKFQQTTFVRYQYKGGPWVGFTWRYDSGLVTGAISGADDALALSGAQQAAMGLFCGNTFARPGAPIESCGAQALGATRVRIPAEGTYDADHNPGRIAPRHLFNLSAGTDNLFKKERYRTTLKFTAVNLSNRVALYNFLSVFAGTHFVTPRAYTAQIGFSF
jgi:hypothetical protein